MATRFVYSEDGVTFTRQDDPSLADPPIARTTPVVLNTGATVYLPSVTTGTRLGDIGQQGWGIYPVIDSATVCEPVQYYESEPAGYSWALDGPLFGTATSAVETRACVPIDIDALKVLKEQEMSDYLAFVLSANCATNLSPNWVLILDNSQRTWIASVNGFLQDRLKDITIDLEVKAYWTKDVPLRFINTNNDNRLRVDTDEAQYGQLMKDIGLHDFAATDAQALCQADIDAAHAADDEAALAAIDVTSAAYGWPPVYTG